MKIGFQHYHSFLYWTSPMNYLRSPLTPPANSPFRPNLDQGPTDDFAHLTPPPRDDIDDTDPLPFIPGDDDKTSLSQLASGASKLDLNRHSRPRLFKYKSFTSATSRDTLEQQTHSDPATPATKTRAQSPRRRNSVPAKRFYQSTNTLVSSPEISAVSEHVFKDNGDDIAPDEVMLIDARSLPQPTHTLRSRRPTTPSGVIQEWLSSTEEHQSPRTSLIDDQLLDDPLTLPPDDDFLPSLEDENNDTVVYDQPEPDMLDDYEGFAATQQLERADTAPLLVPLQIRLRKASKQREKELQLRRRSLPLIKKLTLPTKPSALGDEVLGRISLPELLSQKSASAGPALTQAWTSHHMPGDEVARLSDNGIRRISSTLKVVHSRDSVYEVIWEDTLAAGSSNNSRRASALDLGPFGTAYNSEGTKDDLDRVETTMAAWHWSGNATQYTPPSPTMRYISSRRSSQPALSHDDLGDSAEPSPLPEQSVDSSERADNSWPIDATEDIADNSSPKDNNIPAESPLSQNGSPIRRTSMQMAIDAKHRTPSPVAHIAPSAISGKQRRELLGNRKVSDFSNAEDHFAGHRDSLVLAHKRIFHDQIEQGDRSLHGDEAPDPRVEHLRTETWHMRRASIGSSSLSSSLTSGGEKAERTASLEKGKNKEVGILVHDDESGKRHRGVKHIHVKDVDE